MNDKTNKITELLALYKLRKDSSDNHKDYNIKLNLLRKELKLSKKIAEFYLTLYNNFNDWFKSEQITELMKDTKLCNYYSIMMYVNRLVKRGYLITKYNGNNKKEKCYYFPDKNNVINNKEVVNNTNNSSNINNGKE